MCVCKHTHKYKFKTRKCDEILEWWNMYLRGVTGVFVMSSRALSTEREGDSFECSARTIVYIHKKSLQCNRTSSDENTWRLPLGFARRRQHRHGEDVVHIFLIQRTFLWRGRRVHQVTIRRMVVCTRVDYSEIVTNCQHSEIKTERCWKIIIGKTTD